MLIGDPVSEKNVVGKAIVKIPYLALPTIWLNDLSEQHLNVDVETGE